MKAQKNTVVTIWYTLTDDEGNLIDSSEQSGSLEYLHGTGYLLARLEETIEGRDEGEAFSVVLEAKDGYGEYSEDLIASVPKENFETVGTIAVGMKFEAETPDGPQIVTVKKVTDDFVVIDANHELAGKTLHFDVKVLSVRAATEAELSQGFAGEAGGCGGACGSCGSDCSGCGGGCSCG